MRIRNPTGQNEQCTQKQPDLGRAASLRPGPVRRGRTPVEPQQVQNLPDRLEQVGRKEVQKQHRQCDHRARAAEVGHGARVRPEGQRPVLPLAEQGQWSYQDQPQPQFLDGQVGDERAWARAVESFGDYQRTREIDFVAGAQQSGQDV